MADAEYDFNIDSNSTNSVDIVGLDNIKADNTIDADLKLALVQPFKAETSSALDIEPLELTIKPLKADLNLDNKSQMTLDLKPAVIDLCLTTNIGKVPNVCIHLPYHHHVGFTWYGTEMWGFTFSGQQDMVIEDLERQPKVVWGDAVPAESSPRPAPPPSHTGGLRVRLGS